MLTDLADSKFNREKSYIINKYNTILKVYSYINKEKLICCLELWLIIFFRAHLNGIKINKDTLNLLDFRVDLPKKTKDQVEAKIL